MRRLAYTMRNLFRVSNIGTFAFFIVNFLVMPGIFFAAFAGDFRGYLLLGLIYAFSILLSLAPTGQSALCLLWGARRITREDTRERILPLAEEVFERARREQPLMPHRIHIRVIREPEPNAYAIGIYTIGVTEGLLSLPDSQIQGILAHEMGHLALQHTLIRILFGPCNIFMIFIMAILEAIRAILLQSAAEAASIGRMGSVLGSFILLISGICFLLISCWTGIMTFFLSGSCRANEYEADAFACRIGYGRELAEALDLLTMGTPCSSCLQMLKSASPDPSDRIDRIGRLQALGAGCSS